MLCKIADFELIGASDPSLKRSQAACDDGSDWLDFGKHFYARLCLPRFAGFGTESIDECIETPPLGLLFLGELEIEHLAFTALPLEPGIAAAVERELAGFKVENPVG